MQRERRNLRRHSSAECRCWLKMSLSTYSIYLPGGRKRKNIRSRCCLRAAALRAAQAASRPGERERQAGGGFFCRNTHKGTNQGRSFAGKLFIYLYISSAVDEPKNTEQSPRRERAHTAHKHRRGVPISLVVPPPLRCAPASKRKTNVLCQAEHTFTSLP